MIKITTWFTGIVEDNNDPTQQGRVRVRIFGLHNVNKTLLPTEDLPWSQVMLPASAAPATNAVIALNTWVFGFFRDGDEMQDSVIVGLFNARTSNQEFVNSNPNSYGANLSPGSGVESYPQPNSDSNVFNFSANAISSANTGAYVPSTNFNGSGSLSESFNASQPTPGSLLNAPPGGNQSKAQKIISIAQAELSAGVIETSENQGPGIEKYWTATSYGTAGYRNREPWCAAFVTWIISQAGVVPEANRPKTASAFDLKNWALGPGKNYTRVTTRPRSVNAGDIVVLSHSHACIAIANSQGNSVQVIDGNGSGNKVATKTKPLSQIAFTITIL